MISNRVMTTLLGGGGVETETFSFHIVLLGGWRSDSQVRRYEKGGRVAQVLEMLPSHFAQHAKTCSDSIGAILSGTLKLLPSITAE